MKLYYILLALFVCASAEAMESASCKTKISNAKKRTLRRKKIKHYRAQKECLQENIIMALYGMVQNIPTRVPLASWFFHGANTGTEPVIPKISTMIIYQPRYQIQPAIDCYGDLLFSSHELDY